MIPRLKIFNLVLTLRLNNKLRNHCWLSKRGRKGSVRLSCIMSEWSEPTGDDKKNEDLENIMDIARSVKCESSSG